MNEHDFSHLYNLFLNDAQTDPNILGVILAGSRRFGLQNKDSDCDTYLIFKDTVTPAVIRRYKKDYEKKYEKLTIDLSNKALQTRKTFEHYAQIGKSFAWDRYNLVHAKVEIDKTEGEITQLLQQKAFLSPKETTALINDHLGDYITHVYRSMRSYDADKKTAALIDAAESIHYLLTTLFALHNRVRPFNKYLEFELTTYPLANFSWEPREFLTMLTRITQKADPTAQRMIYNKIETLARSKSYGYKYDAWGGNKLDYIQEPMQSI
ncbi:MAG: hypothetical protein ACR2LN_01430 [Candidatus Levyibacteriota bacterium]